ncbi:7-cyano-7-deazaguanine synthase [Yersinia enterocolitica]|nr:7-cyano-7-deazaguanine synthase [Yersinia enterocolitica]EKN3994437.1 7-cyano-7-deazaguanine synthase [Yersinia enterocolitica]EKN5083410.1 7-cyano-7-deazaguanine synthase [Yersinia enterocolitica]EKN6400320.1 7-cyano-7-deazaguanine synthase [Yersinia enterocolitica]EKP3833009.1 7-cyano-7-deazaguanine synthase [Yersinia enterocolitica]
MKTALLLSGGMDSIAIAWWKRPNVAVTLDYGQRAAEAEISAASETCRALNIEHHIIRVDCRALGSGDMAGTTADANAPASDWWPYRNQMLISLAAMKVITLGVTHLWIGTVKSDGSHLDGTVGFVSRISELMSYQEGSVVVEAPAIEFSTAGLIRESGISPGALAWAHSCHKSNIPCGSCRGCNKYFEVLDEVGYDLDRPL